MDVLLRAYLETAERLYAEDRLDEAMKVVQDAFEQVGWPEGLWTELYNRLTCEKDTRDSAVLRKVNEKLSIEIGRDVPVVRYQDLKAVALEAMKRVGELLRVEYVRPVMITVFRPDAPVDFIVGSYGYAAQKADLDKICFPHDIIETHPRVMMQALMHELTHVAARELAGDRLASWLDEGLATYLCGDVLRGKQSAVLSAAKRGKLFSVGRLEAALTSAKLRKDDPTLVTAAYHLSGTLVEWWAEHRGLESVREALARIGQGEGIERAIRSAAKMSLGDIEREWRRQFQKGR